MLFGKSDASIRGGGFKRQGGVLSHFLPAKGWTHEPRVGGQSPQGLPSNCSPFGPFQTKNTEFYKREMERCRKALTRARVKSSVCLEA